MNDTMLNLGFNLIAIGISKIDNTPTGENWRKTTAELVNAMQEQLVKEALKREQEVLQ